MTGYSVPWHTGTIFAPPTREELRTMLRSTPVVITAIVAVALVLIAFVAAVTFLAYAGKSTEALTIAVVGPVIGILASMASRVKSTERKVDAIAAQTTNTT